MLLNAKHVKTNTPERRKDRILLFIWSPIDDDGDGIGNDCDVCDGIDDTIDVDADNIPDCIDECPNDADNDIDGDGVRRLFNPKRNLIDWR